MIDSVDLDIDAGALYLLAARSTPLEVVEDVVARGKEGRTITYQSVVEAMAAQHKEAFRARIACPLQRLVVFAGKQVLDASVARIDLALLRF